MTTSINYIFSFIFALNSFYSYIYNDNLTAHFQHQIKLIITT